jgi:type IV pilus assembly protein PilM
MGKAKQQSGVWGIDIGQCALKAIRLEIADGKVIATAFDYVEHPKILSQPDADPDQLTREALEKFLERNTLRGDQVVISVPGQSGLARFVKLPPVEEKKITDIVRFEAKQQIPFPLDEVVWDYQKIGTGTVTDGFAMETEIGLFAMKRDMVSRSLEHFQNVNVEVHTVQMAPLALCNFVSYDLLSKEEGQEAPKKEGEEEEEKGPNAFKKRCVVALDIGTDNSNLVITDGDRIIWQRPIPHGGNHFTRALTKELKLTFAKAEHVKRNATKSPDLKKILSALKPVLNDFVGEVQRSLGYFTNTHRDAQVEYVVGLGNAFRLPGLQKFLSEKLQLEVKKLQKIERLDGDAVTTAPAFTQNIMSFAVAYGLALQGLKRTRLHTNLLPHDIRFERMIRAKKPWAVTIAASLLLGAACLGMGYKLQYYAVAAPVIKDAIDRDTRKAQDVVNETRQVDNRKGEVEKAENWIRGIVKGQDDRIDWLLLDRFVNECLPIPGVRLEGEFKGAAADKKNGYVLVDKGGQEQIFYDTPDTVVDLPASAAARAKADDEDANAAPPPKYKKIAEIPPGTKIVVYYEPDPTARQYWDDGARAALDKFQEREAGNLDPNSSELWAQNLIHVSLDAMCTRMTEHLEEYWKLVKERPHFKDMDVEPVADKEKAPSGPGWVVELRGITYHRDKKQFIKRTLLTNLGWKAHAPESPADKAAADKGTGDKAKPPDKNQPADKAKPPDKNKPDDAKKEADKKSPAAEQPLSEIQWVGPALPTDIGQRWKEKIEGRISHVTIFDFDMSDRDATLEPTKFKLIAKSELQGLPEDIFQKETPLLGGLSAAYVRNPGVKAVRTNRNRRGVEEAGDEAPKKKEPVHIETGPVRRGLTRTEFVIFFIWQQPALGGPAQANKK